MTPGTSRRMTSITASPLAARRFSTSERLGAQQFDAQQRAGQQQFTGDQSAIDRALQAAAFDLMCRGRPLKPPPYDFQRVTVRASELALRADKKAGLW